MTDALTDALSRLAGLAPGAAEHLRRDVDGLPDSHHVFDEDELTALRAALVLNRPLLLRGEPGTGKSQLARAAAQVLDYALVYQPVDSQTEARDLLYLDDPVARLAAAQVQATIPAKDRKDDALSQRRFLRPGALWWMLNWERAEKLPRAREPGGCVRAARGQAHERGTVLLIDELDKADRAVPNALLHALEARSFQPPGCPPVESHAERGRLVLVTTNGERELPHAFLRRCLVLDRALPGSERAFVDRLSLLARHHAPKAPTWVVAWAARQSFSARTAARQAGTLLPGVSEFLDLLKIGMELSLRSDEEGKEPADSALSQRILAMTVGKHQGLAETGA